MAHILLENGGGAFILEGTSTPTRPGAPTIGTATAGNGLAFVSYTPPASNGGATITSYTVIASPGGITSTPTLNNPAEITGLTNGVTYTLEVFATNSVGAGPNSGPSNAVTPSGVSNLVLYANGVESSLFPKTPVLSFSATLNYNYNGTSPPPAPGSTQSLQVIANSSPNFGGGWQPGSTWTTIPPNGFDDRQYTQLQFSLYTPQPAHMYIGSHYSRATGNDINASTSCPQGSTCLNIPANTWSTVTAPMSSLALLGAANEYKFVIGTDTNLTYYIDNVTWIAGNLAWAFQGTGAPASGWTDSSINATADYTWLPNSLNSGLYAINNPPNAAAQFTATASGTTLKVSANISGTINIGDTVCPQSNLGGSPIATILSGPTGALPNLKYVLSASAGTIASQPWASAPAQKTITGVKLTASVVNGALELLTPSFALAPYLTFTFGVIPTKAGYGYSVQFLDTTGVLTGSAVATSSATTQHDFGVNTGSFTVHNIPLSSFGTLPANIGGVRITETSSNTSNVTYFSAIGFTSP